MSYNFIQTFIVGFRKWLGSERITIHIADSGDKVAQFRLEFWLINLTLNTVSLFVRSYNTAPILMLSYEMVVRTVSQLQEVNWDLIVCDEAHRWAFVFQ